MQKFWKKNMSTPFIEKLDEKRKEVFQKLSVFSDEFVLAGGTAMMLQIGHRISYDFDLFSQTPLPKNLLRKCSKIFGRKIKVRTNTSDLLLFTTEQGIQVDFVFFPFKPLHKLIDLGPIKSFHLKDLITNKAYTLGRRAMWRDYVDLFFALKWGIMSLRQIIHEAEKRFKPEFNEKLFLEQLSFFEDLEIVEIEFIRKKYSPVQIKRYLEKEVESYLKSKLQNK